MFHWALVFFILALVSAVFGFGGLAGTAATIAKVLFFVGLIAAIIMFFTGRSRV